MPLILPAAKYCLNFSGRHHFTIMIHNNKYILMLEDDSDDRYVTHSFFQENKVQLGLEFLHNSEAVLPFLEHRVTQQAELPSLILLDKSTPPDGGLYVLQQLKEHEQFRAIPVVMISGSALPDEIEECYRYGGSSFIIKPNSVAKTEEKISSFLNYWFSTAELPETAVVKY